MKGAPNPWRGSGQDLEFPSISGREILDGLREIIGNWPGEKTAAADAVPGTILASMTNSNQINK